MLTKEQIEKLTPEQLKIAEEWKKRKEERLNIINEALQDKDGIKKCIKELNEYSEKYERVCPHERSYWSNCSECLEIEKIINPDAFSELDD